LNKIALHLQINQRTVDIHQASIMTTMQEGSLSRLCAWCC
jgi:FixJ family two-component response regulator